MIYKVEDLFLRIRNGMSIKQEMDAGGLPITRIETIANAEINLERVGHADLTIEQAKNYLLEDCEILFSHINSVSHIGKCALYTKDMGELVHGMNLLSFKPNQTLLFPKYALYALRSQQFKDQLVKSIKKAVNQASVSIGDIKNITLNVPPLAQQQRIAAILDKAAEIKAKREQAIAKLDELAQSTFVEMFGDPRNNERKFPLSKIGELLSDFRGGAALKPEDFVEAGFPILHKGAIKQNGNVIIDEGKKTFATHEYAASKSANIINREYLAVTLRDLVPTGPSIGLVASMEDGAYDEYLLAQGAYGFKINNAKLNAEYFVQLSNMPNFRHVLRQFAVGSTQIHIRTPVYQDISIPVPPISLQNEFGELMRKQRLVRKVVVNCLEKYSNLINSLQHQAFTTGFNA